MEDQIIEILLGESSSDVDFAFELLNTSVEVTDESYGKIVRLLNESGKWRSDKKYGFDFLTRVVRENDTTYFLIKNRHQIPELKRILSDDVRNKHKR